MDTVESVYSALMTSDWAEDFQRTDLATGSRVPMDSALVKSWIAEELEQSKGRKR